MSDLSNRISDEYLALQRQLHEEKPKYGTSRKEYMPIVRGLAFSLDTMNVLDYGCGKGTLQDEMHFKIKQYDPCIPQFSELPEPADLVVCTDVLEHIEPDKLKDVLEHIQSLTLINAFFAVDGFEAKKTLPDGRNAHLIIKDSLWWFIKLSKYFEVMNFTLNYTVKDGVKYPKFMFVCQPKESKEDGAVN